MNLRRRAFVAAYLGEAQGNATKAAIIAGYAAASARVEGCRLLASADIQAALQGSLDKARLTVEKATEELAGMASQPVDKVRAGDKLRALELFLRVKGALNDKQGDSRITVNIGFLQTTDSSPQLTISTDQHPALEAQVLSRPPQIVASSDVGPTEDK